jgi:hypothetical protein
MGRTDNPTATDNDGDTQTDTSVGNSRIKVTSQQGKDLEKVTCPVSK